MKLITRLALTTIAMLSLPLAQADSGEKNFVFPKDDSHMIHLEIDGKEGTRFSGSITLYVDDETRYHPLDGTVPFEMTLSGDRIELELTQQGTGSLAIELQKGNNHSRSSVSSPGSTIRLSAN